MTHTICNQVKPSLSVRTRALTSKHHITKSINRWSFIRHNTSLRLRHRNAAPFRSPDELVAEHIFPVPSDCQTSTSACPSDLPNFPSVNNHTTPFATNGAYFASCSSSSASSTSSNTELSVCKWEGCQAIDIERTQLVNHLHQSHVLPQVCNRRKYFSCLWRGCRVFKQPSVSATWLEQHILHHTDAKGKPFRCIFESCSMRFSSSTLLERHVQRTHIRVTRAKTNLTQGLVQTESACPSTQPNQLNSPVPTSTMNLSPVKSSDLVSHVVKKSPRRKKRPRGYRVRRIDFYDNRSRTVIQNRLKIIRLLSNQTAEDENPDSSVGFDSLPPNLPLRLLEIPNKPRLRSFVNKLCTNRNPDHLDTPPVPTSMANRRKHISLLLTIPHTFVGQRLCEDQRTEFLVRWTGGSAHDSIPPTWILEDELLNALNLERKL